MTKPILSEDYSINIILPAATMKKEIEAEQYNLLEYLHNKFNNYHISLHMEVSQSQTVKSIFTPKEKYEHLKKINPLLEQLCKDLKLEL